MSVGRLIVGVLVLPVTLPVMLLGIVLMGLGRFLQWVGRD